MTQTQNSEQIDTSFLKLLINSLLNSLNIIVVHLLLSWLDQKLQDGSHPETGGSTPRPKLISTQSPPFHPLTQWFSNYFCFASLECLKLQWIWGKGNNPGRFWRPKKGLRSPSLRTAAITDLSSLIKLELKKSSLISRVCDFFTFSS